MLKNGKLAKDKAAYLIRKLKPAPRRSAGSFFKYLPVRELDR